MRKSLVVLMLVLFVLSFSVDAIAAPASKGNGAQLKDGSCGKVGQCDKVECDKDCSKCENKEECKKECQKKGAGKGQCGKGAGKGQCGKGAGKGAGKGPGKGQCGK